MPTELRTLVFSNEELRQAVLHFHKNSVEILPSQRISTCEIHKDAGISLHLMVYDEAQNKNTPVVLETPMVAAILLKYCFKERIPVPKKSDKSLQVIGDNLALRIAVNAQTSSWSA